MTEAEWLACEDPAPMLALVRAVERVRKQRLFVCALCRSVWPLLVEWSSQRAVEVAERYADGLATEDERSSAEYFSEVCCFLPPLTDPVQRAAAYLAEYATRWRILTADSDGSGSCGFDHHCEQLFATMAKVPAPAAEFVRDIFDNPCRLVSFRKRWRTDTVLALARAMYEAQEFSAMPILADALQDAGCDSEDVLNHCRSGGPHARGCWVLDRVLCKK